MLGVTATIAVGTGRWRSFQPRRRPRLHCKLNRHSVSVIDTTAKTVTATIGLGMTFIRKG